MSPLLPIRDYGALCRSVRSSKTAVFSKGLVSCQRRLNITQRFSAKPTIVGVRGWPLFQQESSHQTICFPMKGIGSKNAANWGKESCNETQEHGFARCVS